MLGGRNRIFLREVRYTELLGDESQLIRALAIDLGESAKINFY
jgi:hypothetical protein